MIGNKALIAAAVLLFAAPAVPAVAQDDYGDHAEHLRLHRDVIEARYMRCLECPGDWDHDDDDYGWRRRYWWHRYYGGWYGGWRHPGGGWRYPGGGWRYGR
jgi:hypothetical protein